MADLAVLAFGDKGIRFEKRGDRIWVSLTDMAKATGKRVSNWMRLDSTIEFLTEFEAVTHIRVTETVQGGTPEKQGTWAIEEVAIDFASWCNVKFRVWVTQQIKTLMREGTVSIAPQPQPTEHAQLRSAILDRPDPWRAFYEKDFCEKVFKWFGARFYWDYVYCVLTPGEACKVNALNPPVNGVRADKIHQYLTPEIKTRLTPYIRELVTGVDYSATRQDFETGYGNHEGGIYQPRIPGI